MNDLEKKVDILVRLCTVDDAVMASMLKEQLRDLPFFDQEEPSMGKQIGKVLRELGVPEHLSGYLYLMEAIELVVEEPSYLRRITAGLYPDVAKKFQSTPGRTERAIRHAIETAWSRCDLDTLARYFGNTVSPIKGKPVNSEFIACVSNAVRQEVCL